MGMTVGELKRVLDTAIEMGHEDAELRFTYQARYPLQDHVEGVWFDEEAMDDYHETASAMGNDEMPKFYIVSGGQDHDSPYGPRKAHDECVDVL